MHRAQFILRRSFLCIAVGLLLASAGPAWALADPTFASEIRVASEPLKLVGSGIYRFARLVKVCAAALYLPAGVRAEQALEDVAKYLEIFYYRDVTAEQFVRMGDDALRDNVSRAEWDRIQPHLRRFNAFYQNVKGGDRYTLSYQPGVGLELALNSRPLGLIEDAEFAALYYRIWLGENSVNNRFRDEILGLR